MIVARVKVGGEELSSEERPAVILVCTQQGAYAVALAFGLDEVLPLEGAELARLAIDG